MVDFNKRTARTNITIQGHNITVPQPYAEGMELTPNTAMALNGLLAENLRNNLSKRLAQLADGEDPQAIADEYSAKYEFGIRGGRARSTDPVESKALELAEAAVRDALKRQGHKLKDIGNEKIAALAKDTLEKHPSFREKAKAIVEAASSAMIDVEVEA